MSLIAPPLLRRALPALPASWTLPSSWNPVPSLKRAVLEWAPSTETTLADTFLRMGRGDPKTKKGKIFRKSNGKLRPTLKKRRKNKERIAPSIAPPLPEEFTKPFGQQST